MVSDLSDDRHALILGQSAEVEDVVPRFITWQPFVQIVTHRHHPFVGIASAFGEALVVMPPGVGFEDFIREEGAVVADTWFYVIALRQHRAQAGMGISKRVADDIARPGARLNGRNQSLIEFPVNL